MDMTNAVYIQALSPDTLHPAQPLTGLSILLCPADVRMPSDEDAQTLLQFSLRQKPKRDFRHVRVVLQLNRYQIISRKNTDWLKSKSLVSVNYCRVLSVLGHFVATQSTLYSRCLSLHLSKGISLSEQLLQVLSAPLNYQILPRLRGIRNLTANRTLTFMFLPQLVHSIMLNYIV